MKPSALQDREVVELLRDRGDLLAIADATALTQRRPLRRRRALLVVAAAALALTLSLIAPWQRAGRVDLLSEALAAVGNGQIVHVVSERELPGVVLVDLASGRERPRVQETEIWFDPVRHLERGVSRVDGRVIDTELQTPDGYWAGGQRVITCAWIAAHPVEATKQHVSCNASGENGTVPHKVAEPLPRLDPALAGFVSGYRDALRRGQARQVGDGALDGRRVHWLEFRPGAGGYPVERVAVDAETWRPLRVENLKDGAVADSFSVRSIETLPVGSVAFTPGQRLVPETSGGTASDPVESSLAEAARALGGRLLDPGSSVGGIGRTSVALEDVKLTYPSSSGLEPERRKLALLVYGGDPWGSAGEPPARFVALREAPTPESLLFPVPRPWPSEGQMLVEPFTWSSGGGASGLPLKRRTFWIGSVSSSGLAVGIEASSRALLIETGRSLHPSDGS